MSGINEAQQAAINETYASLKLVMQQLDELPEPARSAAAAWAEALLPDVRVPYGNVEIYEQTRAIADRWVTLVMTFLAQFPGAGPAVVDIAQQHRPVPRG